MNRAKQFTTAVTLSLSVITGAFAAESQNLLDSIYSVLPVREGAIHVLVDDLTGDGRVDLAFTSHGGNFVQVYKQVASRRFEVAAEQTVAGFHPNDMIALPGSPKRYLINAEGESRLKVVAAQPDGSLALIAERSQRVPRASTLFNWPDWGMSLAVVPYSGRTLTLLRDVDPAKAEVRSVYSLQLDGEELSHVSVAGLNGDGIQELVLTVRQKNEVWMIEYPGSDKEPVPRKLWSFENGWPRQVIPFDVDRNGTLDLLVPMTVEQKIAVLINDGKANFSEGKSILYPAKPGIHVMATGQEGDGTRYLLASSLNNLVLYQEIKGASGSFEPIMLPMPAANWVELKDVDGDGWLDAVIAIESGFKSMVIYGPLRESFAKLEAKAKAKTP